MVKVVFVCMGNICRSPTAEGYFRHHLAASDLAVRAARLDPSGERNAARVREEILTLIERALVSHRLCLRRQPTSTEGVIVPDSGLASAINASASCHRQSAAPQSLAAPRTPLLSPWSGAHRRVSRVSEKT